MTTIPDRIWEDARALRNSVLWESNSSVEAIARCLLAAEKRGREEERAEQDRHTEEYAKRWAERHSSIRTERE